VQARQVARKCVGARGVGFRDSCYVGGDPILALGLNNRMGIFSKKYYLNVFFQTQDVCFDCSCWWNYDMK
jgi:hypothetical protein